MTNIDADVQAQIYKLFSMMLCGNTIGQIAMDLHVNLPEYLKKQPLLAELSHSYEDSNRKLLNQNFVNVKKVLDDSNLFETILWNNTFSIFAKFKDLKCDDIWAADLISKTTGIRVQPGSWFGAPGHLVLNKLRGLEDGQKSDLANVLARI